MSENPLQRLPDFGQSAWMDFIRRGMLKSGELAKMVREDGLRGVTSNPAIFEKAILATHDYDDAIRALARAGKSAEEIYLALTIEDIQSACDVLRPVYDRLAGRDGYVSLEVNPHLAHDTAGTVSEGRALWTAVHRPNLFIKVPATREGLPAIQHLLEEGVNVNVTLLFGLARYRQVAEAHLAALESRVARGLPVSHVASVASFFLSRIDVLLDPLLERKAKAGGPDGARAAKLVGAAAVASAKLAYRIYLEVVRGGRFRALAEKGAPPQRLLWASTGTKNPAYSDTKYVEPLIGPDTVNTMPLETLQAYRDHGQPAVRVTEGLAEADQTVAGLARLGIDLDTVAAQLEEEGLAKFNQPFDQVMTALREKQAVLAG